MMPNARSIIWCTSLLLVINTIAGQPEDDFSVVGAGLTQFPVSSVNQETVSIDLTGNKISQFNAEDFAKLDSLEKLILVRNGLKTLPDLIHVADTLVYLDLSINKIEQVTGEDLQGFLALRELLLASNKLTSLPDLTPIAAQLTHLDISKNRNINLNQIPDDYFNGFTSMEMLRMAGLELSVFPNLTAIGKTLTNVGVKNNYFTDIPEKLLTHLKHLREFNFGGNNLGRIPRLQVLKDSLWYITATDINITGVVPAETFEGMHKLEVVNMSSNQITEFPDFKFIANTVKLVRVSMNLITYVPFHLLKQLTALEVIYLGDNMLFELNTIAAITPFIRKIRINNCSLTSIPPISNVSSNLEQIRFDNNPIHEISPESFVFLNRNQSVPLELIFYDTLLESMPPLVGPNLSKVAIDVENVPLVCDVRIAWLVMLPETARGMLQGVCNMPTELQGMPLKNLTLADLEKAQKEREDKKHISSHGKVLVRDVYSNSLPMLVTLTSSVYECVALCAHVQGCLYANYHHGNRGMEHHTSDYVFSGNCHYAAPYEGVMYDKSHDANGWNYYHVNTI